MQTMTTLTRQLNLARGLASLSNLLHLTLNPTALGTTMSFHSNAHFLCIVYFSHCLLAILSCFLCTQTLIRLKNSEGKFCSAHAGLLCFHERTK